MAKLIKIKDFSVRYDNTEVLHNISLNIEAKKITAILGFSGCGKTTLLKAMNGLLQEESNVVCTGSILFNDVEIKTFNRDVLRKKIGLLFQQPSPFPMSIEKNITYALKYHGIKNKEILRRIVIEKLQCVNLYGEVKNSINRSALKLSGGQIQRLCIARALAVEPELLLLDEPCSNLDIQNTKVIEESLIHLKESYTFVVVTHSVSQARRIADTIVFMQDGKLLEVTPAKDFFDKPTTTEAELFLRNE